MIIASLVIGIFIATIPTAVLSKTIPRYKMIDLGDLPSGRNQSHAAAINSAGKVVGSSSTTDGFNIVTHAFLWRKEILKDIGTPDPIPNFGQSSAEGINNRGQIVGRTNAGSIPDTAFVWEKGMFYILHPLPGDTASNGFAINNRGDVVGVSSRPGGSTGVFWDSDQSWVESEVLEPLPGDDSSIPTAINSKGQVVGRSTLDGQSRAVLWENFIPIELSPRFGNPAESEATDINNGGQITVRATNGFFRLGKKTQSLPSLTPGFFGGGPNALNDRGHVVGVSIKNSQPRAVLWVKRKIIDLNDYIDSDSGITLENAHDINNSGKIVAIGSFRDDRGREVTHGFLLIPY